MNITLIKPNIGKMGEAKYIDEGRMEPLQLGVLAALTPKAHQVKLYDDRCESLPYDEATDLVAITVESFTARRSYEIADEYRRRAVKVVLGGMHVTLLPQEASAHADAIVTSDAECVWPQLLDDLEQGCLKPCYEGKVADPPQPFSTRRDLFVGKGYLPITLLQFSRGCYQQCSFCASSCYFKAKHHTRSVEDVVTEIKAQKRKLLFFVDDNIVADPAKAKMLFKALIPLKVRWVSQGSLDMLRDDELMRLMVTSGCLGLVIGFESLREESIREMNKASNRGRATLAYETEIEKLRDYGLQTWAAFTLGHDHDTREDLLETVDFAIRHKFTFAAFNILMPYPGTALYEKLEREGRLLYGGKWWLDPEYRFNHAAFVPKQMSAQELTELSFYCRKRFNSPSSVFRRIWDRKTNLRSPYRFFTYLLYNPLFRKEVFKKQGMRFGEK